MKIDQLLEILRERRAHLSVDKGGCLRVEAPKGALNSELQGALRKQKKAIIALLESSASSQTDYKLDAVLPDGFKVRQTLLFQKPELVLLTGATGFLGKYLLAELLQQTCLEVICLVRPTGQDRVEKELKKSGIWEDSFRSRLSYIEGDLAEELIGLDSKIYNELVQKVDLIFHNGAHVHHGLPYSSLRAANVGGTLALLKLAAAAEASFHFVSSLSVLPSMSSGVTDRFFEADPLEEISPPRGGYNLTKWVAERLVENAGKLGLEIVIYRPGPISGHSVTGEFNRQDFLYRLVRGYIATGSAPAGKIPLDLLPVDYAARAMVWLTIRSSLRRDSLRRYHFLHPKPASSELLFEACERAGLGIQRIPYQEWFQTLTKVASAGQKDHPLYPLVGLFASRGKSAQDHSEKAMEVPYDCVETQKILSTAAFPLPSLDGALFDRYLEAIIKEERMKT
jgi:thioester reductase-like protein